MTTYDWTDLTVHSITNLFLYGTTSTPSNHADRLRSAEDYNALPTDDGRHLPISIDMETYMLSGPGRYAHASETKVVQDFFSNAGSLASLADGTYTVAQLMGGTYG